MGIPEGGDIADRAAPVIVNGMAFAASLTAEQVKNEPDLKGVAKLKKVNAEKHSQARRMIVATGTFPETAVPVEDIKSVQQRLEKQRAKLGRRG